MNVYSIALFLHVVGALGFFVALGLEWTGLRQMRGATHSGQVREWMRIAMSSRRLGMPSMLLTIFSGFYMMATVWGAVGWIIVALGALVLIIVLAVALTGAWMAAIGQALANEKGPVSHTLRNLMDHTRLWISIQTRVALALDLVFLMTVKPDLAGSLVTISVATALGLASALPMRRRERMQEGYDR